MKRLSSVLIVTMLCLVSTSIYAYPNTREIVKFLKVGNTQEAMRLIISYNNTLQQYNGNAKAELQKDQDEALSSILVVAARRDGLIEVTLLLINMGTGVNSRDYAGRTALENAADNAQNTARLLIQKGANVNTRNDHGITPLHVSASSGASSIAAMLIAGGANVNAKDNNGLTPLHKLFYSRPEKDIAELLIANGADVNSKDNSGRTPLFYALEKIQKYSDCKEREKQSEKQEGCDSLDDTQSVAEMIKQHGGK